MEPKIAARAKPSWILLDATRVRAEHGFCQALLPEYGKEIAMEGTVRPLMETPMAASISNLDIVRSWKDPRYRRNLSAQQFQTLPEHPAGAAMLTGRELKAASGLIDSEDEFGVLTTSFDCTSPTFLNSRMCGCK